MLWLAAVVALAAPPDKTARLFPIVEGDGVDRIGNMSVSTDGRLVSGRTAGSGRGFVLDVERWVVTTTDECDVIGVGLDVPTGGDYPVWFGCSDGRILPKAFFEGTLFDYVDDAGAQVVFEAPLAAGSEAVALWVDPDSGAVVMVARNSDDLLEAFYYDGATFSLVEVPVSLGLSTFPGFLESQFVTDNPVIGPAIMITHSRNIHSVLNFQDINGVVSGGFAPITSNGTERCDDWMDTRFNLYCLDEIGQLLTYNGNSGGTAFISVNGALGYTLDSPLAVTVSDEPGDSWLAVTGGQVVVWEMTDEGAILGQDGPYFVGNSDNNNQIQDGEASEGVLFGGGVSGNLHIATAKPWMKNDPTKAFVTSDAEVLGTGDSAVLTFEWDEDVTWSAYRGGDRNNPGTLITTGEASADTQVNVEVVVDDGWAEGTNGITIFGDSVRTGTELRGHGRLEIAVDNPPQPPGLNDGSVAAGDGRLVLTFTGIADADLSNYELYVSTAPFTAGDYPTGGPELDRARPNTPIRITSSPSAQVVQEIAPLDNDVTYYIAVRAFDTGGKEGPMSRVVSGTPQQAFSAAELAGEPGGTPCSTTGAGASAGLLLLGLASLRRRRRWLGAASTVLAAGVLLAPAHAQAQDDDKWWQADVTPARGNFEIRYGSIGLQDPDLLSVYTDKPTNLLQLEFGPQILRVIEIDTGLGFFQELAKSVTAGGAQSGDRTMLTWYQFSLDGTLRAHILDEQPIVPFVRYGWDYVIWSEKTVEFGGERQKQGGKFGSHYGLGANILLDLFQPGRASLLEARSGINDTWLTIEWRRQTIDNRDFPWAAAFDPPGRALNFSGDVFQVGIKLDY